MARIVNLKHEPDAVARAATTRVGAIPCRVTARCWRAAAWAAGRLRARAAAAEPILFWSRCPQWGWLSNFAAAGFAGPGGEVWPSVEHWYQAGKTEDPAAAERIRRTATAPAPTASAGCWRRSAPRAALAGHVR